MPVGRGLTLDVGKFVTQHGAEVIESKDNWNYSRSFMFALAIHERFDLVKFYGLEMAYGTEYFHQRPSLEYLAGIAKERGIQVWVPDSCPLFKGQRYAKTVMIPSTVISVKMGELNYQKVVKKDEANSLAGQLNLLREDLLLRPYPEFLDTATLWLLLFESVIWPGLNLFAISFFVFVAVWLGYSNILFFWWTQLTILDVVAALFCVAVEKEDIRIVPYAVLNRVYYIPLVDSIKFLAALDELFGVQMGWGKLERFGRI